MTTSHANALTARWASTLDDDGTVLSGPGVYVLLALLAPFAAGRTREDLLAVAPSPLELPDSPTTRMATAVWSRAEVPLTAAFTGAVPAERRGVLTGDGAVDQSVLDAWAAEQTGGAIPAMPIRAGGDTLMVLASALSVRTTWAERFKDGIQRPAAGPWSGLDLAGLHRTGRGNEALRALRVAGTPAGRVTLLTVAGAEDVDVVLALGETGQPPSAVLPAAITALATANDGVPTANSAAPTAGTAPPTAGTAPTASAVPPTAGAAEARESTDGPGISVREVEAADDVPELAVSTVRFQVKGSHDLLEQAGVFGLAAAADASEGRFPGISPVPMSVSQARQTAVAEFSATGFKAAAVTAIAMRLAGAFRPQLTHRKRIVSVVFDRPFGFLAVHRATGLVLVAGWVEEPDRYRA